MKDIDPLTQRDLHKLRDENEAYKDMTHVHSGFIDSGKGMGRYYLWLRSLPQKEKKRRNLRHPIHHAKAVYGLKSS